MIKVGELQYKNLFILNGLICEVAGFHPNDKNQDDLIVFYKRTSVPNDSWKPINSQVIDPILLTREWLNKFGFRQFANGAYHKEEMLTWRVWYDDYEKAAGYCTDVYPELGHAVHLPIRIEYVHQLQNIYFMMTEKELTINHAHLQSTGRSTRRRLSR